MLRNWWYLQFGAKKKFDFQKLLGGNHILNIEVLYVHPLKVNFLEPRPIQPISLTMEAAAKKFFSLPRFAVAGASQDPHKYGYQGHCFPIRDSMLIAY